MSIILGIRVIQNLPPGYHIISVSYKNQSLHMNTLTVTVHMNKKNDFAINVASSELPLLFPLSTECALPPDELPLFDF